MRALTLLLALLVAAPVAGQSLAELATKVVRPGQVVTNADLKPAPVVPFERPVLRPEAIYERFLARQAARELAPVGPTFVVIGSPTAGPFGEFAPFPEPRRLDGTLYSDPPWSLTTYVGWPYGWGLGPRAPRSGPRFVP